MRGFISKSMQRRMKSLSASFDLSDHDQQRKKPMGIRNALRELSRIERQIKGEVPVEQIPRKMGINELFRKFLNTIL